MSAVMPDTPASEPRELHFEATPNLPRSIYMDLSRGGFLYVYARLVKPEIRTIAHASAHLSDCVLYRAWKPPALIIDDAHFILAESEGAEVERVLGPLGLRIERGEQQA